jgi:hypothetical protein
LIETDTEISGKKLQRYIKCVLKEMDFENME